MKPRIEKHEQERKEQMAEEKKAGEYRCNILRMLYDISNVAILGYIKVIVEDIAKEDTGKAEAGTEKGRISELVAKIDDIWILDQIHRFIENMTRRESDT